MITVILKWAMARLTTRPSGRNPNLPFSWCKPLALVDHCRKACPRQCFWHRVDTGSCVGPALLQHPPVSRSCTSRTWSPSSQYPFPNGTKRTAPCLAQHCQAALLKGVEAEANRGSGLSLSCAQAWLFQASFQWCHNARFSSSRLLRGRGIREQWVETEAGGREISETRKVGGNFFQRSRSFLMPAFQCPCTAWGEQCWADSGVTRAFSQMFRVQKS